jgi:hypothetical protein
MPSDSPRRPQVLKGALVVYPTHTPGSRPSHVIVFQFNPDAMKRTLAHRAAPALAGGGSTGAAKEDVLRAAGPPVETITLTVELHAADQLAEPDQNALVAEAGLHPALAALELLMYPSTDEALQLSELADRGEVQVSPPDLPLLLLVWGKSRVVPVKLTTFSISEEAFDTRLNPIYAKVELGMQVLTYVELTESSVGRDVFISYQKQKEGLALLSQPGNVITGLRNLLPF